MQAAAKSDFARFESKYRTYLAEVNRHLEQRFLPENPPGEDEPLYEAMRYSLMAGGKRIRPILSLAVGEMLGGDPGEILPFACAIEGIHTSALIHDDLIDKDDMRRGKPASHVKFGEAVALLAGDALLNHAYEYVIGIVLKEDPVSRGKRMALELILRATGARGMMGGQMMDLAAEGRRVDAKTLQEMHRLKTGSLIRAAILSAAQLSAAPKRQMELLDRLSGAVGLAFQVKDDILDHGVGDSAKGKSTFVSIHGLDRSLEILDELTGQAISILDRFEKADTRFLKQLILFIKEREG